MKDGNPDKKELNTKIKRLRKNYEDFYKETYKTEEKFQRDKLVNSVDREIINIKTELDAVNSSEKDLLKEMDKAKLQLLEYTTAVSRATSKKNEIDRLKDRLSRINQRLDEVNIELQIPGRVTIVSKAIAPETAENSKKKLFLIKFRSLNLEQYEKFDSHLNM